MLPSESVAPVGRVRDLVAAEQEAQRDQQAAGGDERDHVADTGQQDLPGAGAPADAARRRGAVGGRRRRPSTRAARRVVGGGNASAIILSGSLIARLTPEATTGLPANRCRSLTPTSVAKMTASASAIVVGRQRRAARRALRLDRERHAGPLRGGGERVGGHVGVRDPGRAGGDRDHRLRLVAAGVRGAGAVAGCGGCRDSPRSSTRCDDLVGCSTRRAATRRTPAAPARGPGWTAASCARRRRLPGRRSGTPDRRGRRARRSRRVARAGRTRSRRCRRAASGSAGSRCRRAVRSPTEPRGPSSAAISPSLSVARPASASWPASRPITASLSAPASTSSRTRSAADDGRSGMEYLRSL